VVSHELMETVTDPSVGNSNYAWLDSSGAEIGDKCNFVFGPTDASGADLHVNGHPLHRPAGVEQPRRGVLDVVAQLNCGRARKGGSARLRQPRRPDRRGWTARSAAATDNHTRCSWSARHAGR
jgi:hypothetical protein